MKKTPKDVDAYIASAPKSLQGKLGELRATIKQTAPTAVERISYGMPFYDYKGRLAYFAYATSHIGLYIPPPVIEEHQAELTQYTTAKSTIRFPHDKPLPLILIKKLIKAKMKHNDMKNHKK
jgi:uncharacterized protein YdhG (YjbR/CyaY superfamily)